MAIFGKKSEFEKDRKKDIKAEKKKSREAKKDVRKEARQEKKDTRKDSRADKKEARKEARQTKKGARQDKHDAMKEIRQSDLKGEEKRNAKKEVRGQKKDAVKVAKQDKKDAMHAAKDEKKEHISDAKAEKKERILDIREEKRAVLKAMRVPKAMDRKWVSYLRFQKVNALEIFKPKTLAHLQTICRIATENGLKVRAIGSGHSFSKIGVTDDIFLETKQMNKIFTLGPVKRKRRFKTQYHNTRQHPMVEFEVGRTIIDLSKELEKTGHALFNQGTYDGQTFWGAVSTSTHGSGLNRGPFPEMVLSLVLVGEGGKTYRIEPTAGITNPDDWNEAGINELIQDDDTFYSVVCSFGCMGIVYSAVIKLRPFYWLNEWTYVTTWDTFKSSFANPDELIEFVKKWDTISLLVSPTKAEHGKKDGVSFKGEYPLSLTLREETTELRKIGGTFFDSVAKAFEDIHIIHGKAPAEGLLPIFTSLKRDDGWMASSAVKQSGKHGWTGEELDPEKLPIKRRNKCYKIFPKGGKLFGGYGIELAFPVRRTIEVMDRIIKLAEANDENRLFHTAPVAVRFVDSAKAYASPQFDRKTVMFEVLMAKGTKGGERALGKIEEAMLNDEPAKDIRVHWGLHVDRLSRHNANFRKMYPKWNRFVATFRRFNQKGTFHNEFTDRIGLS